jgi:hypothetical protein
MYRNIYRGPIWGKRLGKAPSTPRSEAGSIVRPSNKQAISCMILPNITEIECQHVAKLPD